MDDQEEVLKHRLAAIDAQLRGERDPARIVELVREREALQAALQEQREAQEIADSNREVAARAAERAERVRALRAELRVLTARRAELEERLRQAVGDAERERPDLKSIIWELPHVRTLAAARDDLVLKISQIEKQIRELERLEKECVAVQAGGEEKR